MEKFLVAKDLHRGLNWLRKTSKLQRLKCISDFASRKNTTSPITDYLKGPYSKKLGQFLSQSREISNIIDGCSWCMVKRLLQNPSHFTRKQYKEIHKETKALHALVGKAGIHVPGGILQDINSSSSFQWFSKSGSKQQDNWQQRNDDSNKGEEEPEDDRMPVVARLMMMFWIGFLFYVVMRLQAGTDNSTLLKFVSWNEFQHEILAKGEVAEIIVRPEAELAVIKLQPGAIIKGKRIDHDILTMKIIDAEKFEEKLRKAEADLGIRPDQGVSVSYQRENSWAPLVVMLIIGAAMFAIFRNILKIQLPTGTDMFASERKAKFVRADIITKHGKRVSFKDVAGLHEAKVEVMEFVDYLKRPERFKALGGRIPKGALLLGPPGCGKTLLAKAVSTEAKVPFLAMAGSEFVEMLGGLGAARVRDLFKEAREKAPCIIYLDEIDAIGRRRGGQNMPEGSSEEEHTLNQLLVELDGMGTTDGVIMLASTNRHDVLDKALLRPGRFDRHIMIDLPTLAERKEIFEIYLKKLRLAKPPSAYSSRLAQLSPGMSGADIANICNEAALHAARDLKKFVDVDDFEYAVERVTAGVAKKSRVLSPKEKKIVAYHEAGHAVVSWMLEHTDALIKVTIVPRTNKALGFTAYQMTDRKLHSKEELFETMCMALGGRVAESLTFNSITQGAQNDLVRVTDIAYKQIKLLGMNDVVGHLSFPMEDKNEFATKPYSKKLAALMDEEARKLLAQAYKRTEQILTDNKLKLQLVAEALLEKESLSYKDMEELIGPPPFGQKQTVEADWE